MLDPEFEGEITRQLGDGRRPVELIPFVCARTGLNWDAAKEEILRVQSRHQEIISRRRRWVILGLWLPVFIAASLVLIGNIVAFVVDPRGFLLNAIRHPETLAVFGVVILTVGGGLAALFRGKQTSKGSGPRGS